MDNRVAAVDCFIDQPCIGDVAHDPIDGSILQRSDNVVEQRAIVVTIEDAEIVSLLEQQARDPGADEAVSSGYENLQRYVRSFVMSSRALFK